LNPYHSPLMSVGLPDSIDAWRAAGAGRVYSGRVELARLARLLPSLVDGEGSCNFQIAFERNEAGQALARVTASAELPLQCQRSLERFLLPVQIEQTLGLLRSEAEEAGLPPEVEPVLVPADGMLQLLDLLEDELILALPALPTRPGTAPVERRFGDPPAAEVEARPNPFAALAALKQTGH